MRKLIQIFISDVVFDISKGKNLPVMEKCYQQNFASGLKS